MAPLSCSGTLLRRVLRRPRLSLIHRESASVFKFCERPCQRSDKGKRRNEFRRRSGKRRNELRRRSGKRRNEFRRRSGKRRNEFRRRSGKRRNEFLRWGAFRRVSFGDAIQSLPHRLRRRLSRRLPSEGIHSVAPSGNPRIHSVAPSGNPEFIPSRPISDRTFLPSQSAEKISSRVHHAREGAKTGAYPFIRDR